VTATAVLFSSNGSNISGNSGFVYDGTNVTINPGYITAYSDERLKENVEVITNALGKVCAIRGVTYNRKDIENKGRQAGVIAQEIQRVLPEVVITHDDEMGTLSVAYGNIVALLIEAIKELKTEVDNLKKSLHDDNL
jgi:hypothetical protein